VNILTKSKYFRMHTSRTFRLAITTPLLASFIALVACGGGENTTSKANSNASADAPTTSVTSDTLSTPITNLCASSPSVSVIGPFGTTAGDCVVTYAVSQAHIDALSTDSRMLFRTKLLAELKTNFQTDFDVVFVVVLNPTLPLPFTAGNFTGGDCIPGNAGCTRENKLGTIVLFGANQFRDGPILHELIHGYAAPLQGNLRSVVPTSVLGHWGFSSVGGQLGGWDSATFRQIGSGTYQAFAPKAQFKSGSSADGSFGVGGYAGNFLPYAKLELYLMGLVQKGEIPDVKYASAPAFTDRTTGTFTASAINTLTADQIEASLTIAEKAWVAASPKTPRGIVVAVSTNGAIDSATLQLLNRDIDQFSMTGIPTIWRESNNVVLHNFYTATEGRGRIKLNEVSAIMR
jgi:hypothetical protein